MVWISGFALTLLGVIIFSILGFCMHIVHYYFEFISLFGVGFGDAWLLSLFRLGYWVFAG